MRRPSHEVVQRLKRWYCCAQLWSLARLGLLRHNSGPVRPNGPLDNDPSYSQDLMTAFPNFLNGQVW